MLRMRAATSNERPPGRRRVPQQVRSRERVRRILDVAGRMVVRDGVDALSTRAVAEEAGVPVASLYQYFADKDEILLALVQRDIEEMDAQVAADLGELRLLTVRALVETTMRAFVKVYLRRPSFVVTWLRGRTNPAIQEYGRAHNRRVAADLHRFAADAGLLADDATVLHAELAVEVGDRLFQLAFEHDVQGDQAILDEAVELVCAYLERHAAPAGLTGVPA